MILLKKKGTKLVYQFVFMLVLLIIANTSFAQKDSLILKTGDIIVGEIKSLDKGVVTIETDYSKNDFKIEWSGIKEIYSKSIFLVTLKDGQRINGSIRSLGDKKIAITDAEGVKTEAILDDIVYLKGLKSDFWSRLHASLDVGLSLSKANNLHQFNVNSNFGYIADKWQLDLYFNTTRSSQDSDVATKRSDAGITYKYFLQRDWYLLAAPSFLSNTEQALKLRMTGKLGAGKFLVHTNKSYWGAGGGISFNNESFTNGTPQRNSVEAYAGSELNMFDIGDLNLLSSLYLYPSLTESGRFRSDFKLDTKYDLPLDFYVKLGLTLNYDNKPAVTGKETDYVMGFTIGWEL